MREKQRRRRINRVGWKGRTAGEQGALRERGESPEASQGEGKAHSGRPVFWSGSLCFQQKKQKAEERLFWELSKRKPNSIFKLEKAVQRVYLNSSLDTGKHSCLFNSENYVKCWIMCITYAHNHAVIKVVSNHIGPHTGDCSLPTGPLHSPGPPPGTSIPCHLSSPHLSRPC